MATLERHHKMLLLSMASGAASWLALGLISLPDLAGALGISTSSASTTVNLLSAYSTVSSVVAIVGAITGVGSIGAGITAIVYALSNTKERLLLSSGS
ncbi:TPA: uberolysin/carnocyclin family circular bacteriocin [Streptococcus equi subsp. zooepidemicus]|uniref:uberolysin/carnocyclin family circular bacteriocin n=1 Tax=Streptococcus equi TaxID=1336 RepID=UPI0013F5E689|nr:uberolysin/carnocyclin family circular bacteriocin [Streptococcus equi]QUF62658.1 uberolysin/carnocyclin family circular bacteriocin [Streptococcus equi subsp. zooepidemicus]QWN61304.1 uberolysin/carnocyclin family circular bacteriocin [Streptococcus equi subsp. zooepidemicus]HEL0792991.1 uberolysin/carnocyclin family circular bacteriocin [Streptococcus equi subsp. zooepidemicus]HEL0797209.1 uberolysin/carnocyclin family circular bacteriocin [Streptococcus equi subsp. zooepidemicus]HEL11880